MKNSSPKSTSRCIESIKLLDGELLLLDWHQKRVDKTLLHYYKSEAKISLKDALVKVELPKKGLHKVRVVYDEAVHEVTFKSYEIADHKLVKLVEADFDYAYKYESREELDKFIDSNKSDDVIYVKNGLLTDAWYSNVILRKSRKWYTPKSYMLDGVKRQFLLGKKEIKEKKIKEIDLEDYDAIAFINAMRDFEKVYSFKRNGDLLTLTTIT